MHAREKYSAKLSVMSAVVRSKNRSADQRTDYGKIGFDRQANLSRTKALKRWPMADARSEIFPQIAVHRVG